MNCFSHLYFTHKGLYKTVLFCVYNVIKIAIKSMLHKYINNHKINRLRKLHNRGQLYRFRRDAKSTQPTDAESRVALGGLLQAAGCIFYPVHREF